jgi:glutathione synthetase
MCNCSHAVSVCEKFRPPPPSPPAIFHRQTTRQSLPGSGLVQIELNTISCAFAALGTKVVELHRHLAESGFVPDVAECGDAEALAREFPVSDALGGVAAGLAAACAAAAPGAEGAVVVMVVQPGEKNSFDQSILAATLQRAHGVRTLRRTLAELGPQAAGVGAAARELWIEDDADETTPPAPPAKVRVGVVYYRAGYTPRDYPGEAEWDARLALERTSAAKCPTVGYQLAGTKKVQQVLAAQGALVPYLADQAERDAVRATFAGLWPLDGDRAAVDAVVARAIADPPHFVLKPQREGGGNNLYDAAMVEALRTLPRAELEAHILMERVYPPATAAYIVRRDAAVRVDRCVSELGVFTVFIASGSRASGNLNVSLNEGAGYILRTKSATDADGGVAAGVAVMDSVQLQH